MATTQEQFKARDTTAQAGINSNYDAGLAAQKQSLLDAYNTNTQAQTQHGQNIQNIYTGAGLDVGVQNARNARELNQFADLRTANRGAGSQLALNLGNTMANSAGMLAVQQQAAAQENERQRQLMTASYQNQVQAAIADNDYKRAAQLLDNYKNQQNWQDQQAAILASYGNFDPYAQLYGQDVATGMQNVWNAQNPETAYRLGRIDAETYKSITGRYPAGYTPPSAGGGYWGYYDWPGSTDTKDRDPSVQAKVDAQRLARSEKQIAALDAKAASQKAAPAPATTKVTNWWFNSRG